MQARSTPVACGSIRRLEYGLTSWWGFADKVYIRSSFVVSIYGDNGSNLCIVLFMIGPISTLAIGSKCL
jgi:hypothetical protein